MERMMNILNQLENVRKSRTGYIASCPAHHDRSPSLSISEGDDGRVLLHCFSGCTLEQICDALGISVDQLFPDAGKVKPKQLNVFQRKRKLERKYEMLERFAFVAMADFRDSIRELFDMHGVDIPDDKVDDAHKLPLIEYYLETLSTGSSEEKLQLLREGVIAKWAKLYSPTMICQLSRKHH